MGDTRAINILIAGMIIFIVIAGFYTFLTKQTIEKQNNAIKGSAGTLQTDRMIAEWASQTTTIRGPPEAISASFAQWFTDKGFLVGNVVGGNLQYEPPRCKEAAKIVTCDFALSRTEKNFPRQKYEQTILIPEANGVRTIVFRGLVTYE